jgi:hypothetical protein
MAATENSIFGQYLDLFAHTEIFIFVFMEIVTKMETIQRVIFKKAKLNDYIFFTIILAYFPYSVHILEYRIVLALSVISGISHR